MDVFKALLMLNMRYPSSGKSSVARSCKTVCNLAVAIATISGFGWREHFISNPKQIRDISTHSSTDCWKIIRASATQMRKQ